MKKAWAGFSKQGKGIGYGLLGFSPWRLQNSSAALFCLRVESPFFCLVDENR
jgi:hypothetical protein